MKSLLLVTLVGLVAFVSSDPRIPERLTPASYIDEPNWKIYRYPRSADPEPQGSIVLQGQKPLSGPDRRPTINLDYQHKIWEGRNGHVSASGGGQKLPGQRFEPHVGIQGTWRFRRSADPEPQTSIYVQGHQDRNHPGSSIRPHDGVSHCWRLRRSADPEPQGSIVFEGQKPLSGRDRRPTINLDYQHKIWEGRNGEVSASGGGQKLPGQRFEPHVGIQGTWRFRRSADPEPQTSIYVQGHQDRNHPGSSIRPHVGVSHTWRFRRSADPEPQTSIYVQGHQARNHPGSSIRPHVGVSHTWRFRRSADPEPQTSIYVQGHQARNHPGSSIRPHVGVSHTWRFRRSADPEPQGSIVFEGQKPLSGRDRRPTINLDYQHKIWEGKNGEVSASGGGQKLPGQRFEPHVGIQGTWRFRRSADPEPQTSIYVQGHQDRNHPGSSIRPHVGVSHTWRFRRSADPEPQGSIVFEGQKPLSGRDRRPTINLDYQHKIWEGKNGEVSASGGGQKLPGQRFEPHVGIQGTWRFRRSADPEPQTSIYVQGHQDRNHPGSSIRPHVGVSHTWRFRRSADPEPQTSIYVQGHQPRNHPGSSIKPHVGVSHTWRFRRSADPEPQGSIVFEGQKPLSGRDRRPTINLDYQHKIWEGKNGEVSASGGGQKLPGQRFEPHVGIQGTWRFRRSADPEPQTSIYVQGYQDRNHVGSSIKPHLGVSHTWRFRRSADPEPQTSIYVQGHQPRNHPGSSIKPHVGVSHTWRF